MSIDFSKAPEGATHYSEEHSEFYYEDEGCVMRFDGENGEWFESFIHEDMSKLRPIFEPLVSIEDAQPTIDFGSAPEGATHYMPTSAGVNWYCGQGDVSMLWDQGGWVVSYVSMGPPLVLRIPNAKLPNGSKHDSGKPVMGAVPPNALLAVARVLTFGAEKYGRDNWQKVENMEVRYLDATLRHINAHQRGETTDPESGESHLAHAVCSLMFMLEVQEGE